MLRVAMLTLALALTSTGAAWAERIRLDCDYVGTGQMLMDRPFGNGSLQLLIDDTSGTAFQWNNGDWRALTVHELSPARFRIAFYDYNYEISRTNATIRMTWHEDNRDLVLANGTCRRVADTPQAF